MHRDLGGEWSEAVPLGCEGPTETPSKLVSESALPMPDSIIDIQVCTFNSTTSCISTTVSFVWGILGRVEGHCSVRQTEETVVEHHPTDTGNSTTQMELLYQLPAASRASTAIEVNR